MTDPNDPRLSDLVSIADAAKLLNLSWWQTRRAMDNGTLTSVLLPSGGRAVVRASIERLLEERACHQGQLKPLLTPQEFWEGLGKAIGKNAIYELIRSGKVRHVRVGQRKVLIPSTELEDFLRRQIEEAHSRASN